jgi:acetoacetyl-CoA synthetase
MATTAQKRVLWKPKDVSATQVDKLRVFVNGRHGLSLRNYSDLHAYSVGDATSQQFWLDLFYFLEMKSPMKPTRSLETNVSYFIVSSSKNGES